MEDTSGRPERVRRPTRPSPVPIFVEQDLGPCADPRSIVVEESLDGYRPWLGIMGESLMLSRALSSLHEDHSHRRYRLHRWSIGSSVAGTGA